MRIKFTSSATVLTAQKADPRFGINALAAALALTTLVGCADFSGITAPLNSQWWLAFGDDSLNQLEAQAPTQPTARNCPHN